MGIVAKFLKNDFFFYKLHIRRVLFVSSRLLLTHARIAESKQDKH